SAHVGHSRLGGSELASRLLVFSIGLGATTPALDSTRRDTRTFVRRLLAGRRSRRLVWPLLPYVAAHAAPAKWPRRPARSLARDENALGPGVRDLCHLHTWRCGGAPVLHASNAALAIASRSILELATESAHDRARIGSGNASFLPALIRLGRRA